MKSAIQDKAIRSLPVDDFAMSALPDTESRKNKRLGFDDNVQPMLFDAVEFGMFDYILVDSFEKGFVITTRYQALHYVQDDSYFDRQVNYQKRFLKIPLQSRLVAQNLVLGSKLLLIRILKKKLIINL
ncbi:MAG: hypothetical protein AB8W78_12900 [Arsenophonus endosymbiont of Dermacentor nuttalli]